MKILTATDLKTRTGEFFEALLAEGCVTITRNGRAFPLRLERTAPAPKISLGSALAMTSSEQDQDWDFPKADLPTPKAITFER